MSSYSLEDRYFFEAKLNLSVQQKISKDTNGRNLFFFFFFGIRFSQQ